MIAIDLLKFKLLNSWLKIHYNVGGNKEFAYDFFNDHRLGFRIKFY